MATPSRLYPIYNTRGEVDAYLVYPYIYNRQGEWIGIIAADRKIYSVHGHYVGWLGEGPRILRKVSDGFGNERIQVPHPPSLTISLPASVPLAPLMAELTFGIVDVLQDRPDLLPSVDFGELREDMD